MYVSRILPQEEWYRLKEWDIGAVLQGISNEQIIVLVVEKDDEIVGVWSAIQYWHAECVQMKEKGNSVVARRLLFGMNEIAKSQGVNCMITAALTPEVRKLIEVNLKGKQLPGEHFVFPIGY